MNDAGRDLGNCYGFSGKSPRVTQFLEVLVFLFLILPSMAMSFVGGSEASVNFLLLVFAIILRDLSLLSLIVFFVWRNNEAFSSLGWTTRGAGREMWIGVLLYIPFFYLTALLNLLLQQAGLSSSSGAPAFMGASNNSDYFFATIMVVVVAISEEIIFRGYLILRFKSLTRNTTAAILMSAAIFAVGHGYEGSAGVVTVAFMGIIFAGVYHWRGSLMAPIVMHFLQDFIGVVILPLFGTK